MSDTLPDYSGQTCDWYDLPCHASSFAHWLWDALLFIPHKVFEWMTDGIAAAVGAVDLPVDTSAIAGLSSGALWFCDLFAVPEGVGFCMAALLARFALKLIPTLGF